MSYGATRFQFGGWVVRMPLTRFQLGGGSRPWGVVLMRPETFENEPPKGPKWLPGGLCPGVPKKSLFAAGGPPGAKS